MINLILNVLWFTFGFGFLLGGAWLLAALLMVVSIVGIPFARSAFNMAMFSFWPFGRTAIGRDELTGREDLGTGALGGIANLVWLILAGWWLALLHLMAAIADALTIIGLPFAWQHLKLAGISLFPVGKTVVDNDLAEAARRRNAGRALEGMRQ